MVKIHKKLYILKLFDRCVGTDTVGRSARLTGIIKISIRSVGGIEKAR
jgi:hypothetical protein